MRARASRHSVLGIVLFLILSNGGSLFAAWEYSRLANSRLPSGSAPSSGILTISKRHGATLVSARQFCYAFDCKVAYQWPSHRAVVQNPEAGLSAIVSPLTHFALIDGQIIDFEGELLSEVNEGYLFPIDLGVKLAARLKLGRVAWNEDEPSKEEAAKNADHGGSLRTIVIDPGHGGNDWGTGFGGIYEKDVALIYALKLKEKLEAALPEAKLFLTRDSDRYVSLPDRAKFANERNAGFFISIHVNHASDPKVEGVETYILSPEATDDEARKVALLENDTWMKSAKIKEAGDSVRKILVDMEQTRYIQNSALAAALMQQEMSRLERTHGLKSRGVKQAMFYVLSQVAMPSTLIEMGFLSSTGDRGRLMELAFRDEFVKCLVDAVKRYNERLLKK